MPTSITADGTRLYANRGGAESGIVMIYLDEDFRVEDVIAGPGQQSSGAISADRAWLAYVSDDSGEHQVYITAADGQGGRVQASRSGGTSPAWSPDGTKLYFNTGRARMVVEVKTPTDAEGGAVQAAQGMGVSPADLEISPPNALFDFEPGTSAAVELTSDGEGFLTVSGFGQGAGGADEIIVTLNFNKELERLAPVEKR